MHFRFRHLREDAAEGSTAIVPCLDVTPWPHPCHVCGQTTGNTMDWSACVVCNEPRGTWPCECGHCNPAKATECETCGRPKPEDLCDT